ncbi:2-oxoglutarate dehydrogenase complex dihydrolipoyllysine-residue succinyltransferase [Geotalea uraniireducens]|uniref:Dihydrolipoyllysine-residue succinyltransferase component of 2-oxoglutarate dehydrogenase complex n=1 Tax=Geotalea uraniireducens (strain Rf4) TaxID=351605 RepID=A5GAD6_GEOUR|nr:2-oxoglutarate dehydrogenase complex dihydrolipoyllysine-residue succinyltransferase [Geotalea uraniireducens]ABQ25465.1 2-oxoglutarate dehydrogenase E2 component [Geotalea uraniireducens Rf4]
MEIKIPAVGESVFEALVAKWLKTDGELVKKDEPLCEIETDKITLEINAEAAGVLSIRVKAGETVKIGTVIGAIDEQGVPEGAVAPGVEPAAKPEFQPVTPQPPLSPAVRKMAQEKGLKPETILGSGKGGRITVDDLLKAGIGDLGTGIGDREKLPMAGPVVEQPSLFGPAAEPLPTQAGEEGRITRKPMTPIRKRIAERLLAVRQQTAMLTTFNEADMGRIIALRKNHNERFMLRHGVALGFMPFFVKACIDALKAFPIVNARIDGDDIVYQHFYDIGIAIGGEKGLVVPIIRDADRRNLAEIEKAIQVYVERVKINQLNLADITGGTFTISNGGVYGSMLSTPIINPPQSGVLGMHAIQERPVALDGKVVIRPMMYLALSYDHRIIDGREAVGFLKKIKECIEDPEEMLLEG